jgi:hypothetical protein
MAVLREHFGRICAEDESLGTSTREAIRECDSIEIDRGHEKLPTGGHLIPHPSGSGSTVRCSCTVDRREDAHEERKDAGGDHRLV